jgi:Predicted nucleotide-binding protein containing TIR-like domain
MSAKPRLFVASSREALPLAQAIQQNLMANAFVTVWDQDAIHPGETVIDGLIRNCAESQFGVFVISPDDTAIIRDQNVHIVRDNVILELGMFMGRLGKERSFLVTPDFPIRIHLPRDLDGLAPERYDASQTDNLRAALGPSCTRIGNAIRRQVISQLSSQEDFLNSLVRFSLETVCRAMGVPSTPEQATLRLFIFRKEGEELVCRHYWDPNPSDEQVGVTRFPLTEEAAKEAIIVQCYLANQTRRTTVLKEESHGSEVSGRDIQGAEGKIKAGLKYVLAAPIRNQDGSIWGVVDFDTSNEIGKAKLQTDLAGTVMLSLVRQLRFILLQA